MLFHKHSLGKCFICRREANAELLFVVFDLRLGQHETNPGKPASQVTSRHSSRKKELDVTPECMIHLNICETYTLFLKTININIFSDIRHPR